PMPGVGGVMRVSTARALGLLAALAMAMSACADDDEDNGAADEDGQPSGSARFLIAENFWADWSPYASTAQSQRRLERQIYDYLVDFPTGDPSQPEPMLATEWRQVDDLTWEFDLREGVQFHDGSPLTADDVKASVELGSGFSGESAYALTWLPAQVEVVGDTTVRISTEQPFAPLLVELGQVPILSAEFIADPQDTPNGTGPFRLVSDEVEVKTMEANTEYWRDPPRLQTLVWEFIADPTTRLNALLDGSAQAIDRVPPEQLAALEDQEGIELVSVTGIESVNLWVRPGRLPIWDENINFRRAVNWSIDRQPLVDNLVLGNSRAATSYLPTNTLLASPQEPVYAFDPQMAASELGAAGVPDGGPEFELWVAEGFLPRGPEVVQAIVAQMEEVGLKPQVVTSDVAGMIDDIFSETGTGAMYHLSWSSNGDPNAAAQVYSEKFAWYFGDEALQALIDEGMTMIEPDAREQVYADLQRHMWEQAWHVPLYNSDFTIAHSSDLQGVVVAPDFRTDFYTAELVN
ncbi:MAG: ABC transporter substrate-binding protein, partial [Acidimicrobiales bacterium]